MNGVPRGLLFDARTHEQVGDPLPYPGVEAVAYSPDGNTLAVGGYTGVGLLDARTHRRLAGAYGGHATRIAFTSDGSRLAVVESNTDGRPGWITIRDAATLQPIGEPIAPAGFRGSYLSQHWVDPSIALTPDGRSLVTTSADGELTWWDLDSREKTRTLEIAPGYRALALSPDGLMAAIGLDDGIQLIDLPTLAVREAKAPSPRTPTGCCSARTARPSCRPAAPDR